MCLKSQFSKLILVWFFLFLSLCLGAKTLYVSPTGSDKNVGTLDKPLASFAKAQQQARTFTATEKTEVVFANGVYYLPQTIIITPADNHITYRAQVEGGAVISGGNKIALKWKKYKNGIFVAAVKGNSTIDQLYVNGERQRMARYPNAVEGKNVFDAWELSHNAKSDSVSDPLNSKRVATWANPQGAYIHAMHNMLWGDMHWLVKGKKADGKLDYDGGWQNNRPSSMHHLYRMVENVFEELDMPGEWYFNVTEQKLYYMPAQATDLKKAVIEIVRLKTLVEFKGSKEQPVQHVALQGFVFRHAARTFMENKEQLLRSDWTVSRTAAVMFNGATDCAVTDCEFDQVGGNSILVNNYNQRIAIKGCYIHDSGASGVVFVGDPAAVRSPLFRYGKQNYASIDRTPGPKSDNYPANCIVDNCLITRTGRDEKQTAPVHISMAFGVTVSHCSIYDVPRAGININEGTFGGHVVEFCDVFNTVLETGDHGSFNSWGRDRYWTPSIKETCTEVAKDTTMPFWDMLAPNVLRNTRWRCDHGWDIDLDDGSTNYLIYNNLMLNGGLKLREGYRRIATNNVIVNNSLHPHVWYENSGDVFRHNIVFNRYFPAIMNSAIPESGKWGKEVDYNYFVASEAHMQKFNVNGCDFHSAYGDANFVNATKGNFTVNEQSAALKLGFVNFPMDQFGVKKSSLKAIAKTPIIPALRISYDKAVPVAKTAKVQWMDVELKEPKGEEMSAFGIAFDAGGVALSTVQPDGLAAKLGFKTGDLIQEVDGVRIKTIVDLNTLLNQVTTNSRHSVKLIRDQSKKELKINQILPLLKTTR